MKYAVKKLTTRKINGFRFPHQEQVATFDTLRQATAEAARLKNLMPENFIVENLSDERGDYRIAVEGESVSILEA